MKFFRLPYLHQLAAGRLGVDRAVAFGTLSRVWTLTAGPVTLLLIATHFTPEIQGYYYTFNSLLGLSIFLELGLGVVIQQFASHEWAGLTLDRQGRIVGAPPALSRLAGLARMSFRWFGVASVLSATGVGLAGYLFFSRDPSPRVQWGAPWVFLCVFLGMHIFLMPAWSLLDGCDQISETNRARFSVAVVTSGVTWGVILAGAGLWTAPAGIAAGACTAGGLLLKRYGRFFGSLNSAVAQGINWRQEVWPMQWRIALSWVSNYFIIALSTPVLFHERGPVVAGQFGMTWAVLNALLTASLLWVSTKTPMFGMLIARKRYAELDSLFKSSTLQVLAIGITGAVVIFGGICSLNLIALPLANRLLDPSTTAVLLVGTVVNMFVNSMAAYLRAHKREPYLLPSLFSGLAIGSSTIILAGPFGAMGVALSYSLWTCVFLIPQIVIFLRCRRLWHRTELAGKTLR